MVQNKIKTIFPDIREVTAVFLPSVYPENSELESLYLGCDIINIQSYKTVNGLTSFMQFKDTAIQKKGIEIILREKKLLNSFLMKKCKPEQFQTDIINSLELLSDYHFFKSDSGPYWYSAVPKESPFPRFSLDREEILSKSIKAGNISNVRRLIDAINYENTEEMILSLEMSGKLHDYFIIMFYRFLSELESAGEFLLVKNLMDQLRRLKGQNSALSFFNHVKSISNTLSKHYQGIRNSHREQLTESIRHYIESSFMHPEMGLQMISSHFHLTKEYISFLFKEETGQNFSACLENLRIEHAKTLISTTKFPLQDIGQKCGFNTALTFRRTFKKITGLTPSEFRIEYKKKPELNEDWVSIGKYSPKELIFAHTAPTDGLSEKAAQLFAGKVDTYTNGFYSVKIYPESLLGYDTKLLELVAAGGVDFAVAGLSIYAQYQKEIILLLSPFVVSTYEQGWEMYKDSMGVRLTFRELETRGFRVLSFWERGFRCITAKQKIIKPDDARGLRIRVPPNPLHKVIWDNLGAVPIPMEIKKVYEALKQDEIDAQENPISTIWAQRFYEVAPHITLTRHMYSPLVLSTSMKSWMNFSKEHQQGIQQAATEVGEFSKNQVQEFEQRMILDMEKQGSRIYSPDISEWRKVMSEGNNTFRLKYGLLQS